MLSNVSWLSILPWVHNNAVIRLVYLYTSIYQSKTKTVVISVRTIFKINVQTIIQNMDSAQCDHKLWQFLRIITH